MIESSESDCELLRFHTRGGLELLADAWGSPQSTPVILAHGGGQTRHAWGGTARALAAAGWYAISIDQRGHGDSDWASDGRYGFEDFAADIRDVAMSLTKKPAVVGASLGGIASLKAQCANEGPCFSALVLVDIIPNVQRSGAERVLGFMAERMDEGFASLEEAADVIAAYLPHRPRPQSLDGLAKNLRRNSEGRYHWHWDPEFVRSRTQPNASDRFEQMDHLSGTARELQTPMLLVRGRMSELVSEEAAREFLREVPHAQYVDVSGAGHMVAGDRNDVFSEAVIGFLEEIRAHG